MVTGRFEGDLRRYLRGLGGLLVFLLVWWIGAMTTQPSYLVPGPLESVHAFIDLFATSTPIVVPVLGSSLVLPTGLAHLAQTLFHYVPGLLLGALCGISLGLVIGWNGALDDWSRPLVRVLRPIPPLAWVVFAIVWFGIHHTGAAFIVFVGAFWINFYGAYGGVEGVSSDLTDAASTLGVERDFSMLKLVALPSAAPQVLTGVRTSIGRCWMIVVGAEFMSVAGTPAAVRTLREGERYAVFGLAAAAVFTGSVVDPPTGSAAAEAAATRPLGVSLDKWVHAGGYAVLAGLLCYATSARTTRAAVLAALVVSGYGLGIELVQGTLPARTFDLADATANAAGSGLAALAWRVRLAADTG